MSTTRALQSLLQNFAAKLGLDEDTTLKAKEYLLVYQNKSSSSLLNIGDVAKGILCLDLASKYSGIPFDQDTALKLCALKPRIYKSHLNNLEKILGLDKPLTVTEACVVLGCTELQELAETLLSKYQEAYPHADILHPQYIAVGIWTISKLKSHKLIRQKVVSMSRLKPSQFKELEASFKNFAASVKLDVGKRKTNGRNDLAQTIVNYAKSKENEEGMNGRNDVNENADVEDYDVWRKRIWEQAYKALEQETEMD